MTHPPHPRNIITQESIPVEWVPPASVAITRCQYWLEVSILGVYLVYPPPGISTPWYIHPWYIPPRRDLVPFMSIPRRDLVPFMPTPGRDLGPGMPTSPHPRRETTLAGGKNGLFFCFNNK